MGQLIPSATAGAVQHVFVPALVGHVLALVVLVGCGPRHIAVVSTVVIDTAGDGRLKWALGKCAWS